MEECTTRMMDLTPFDLTALNSILRACAMILNQQNFTMHNEQFNFSTIFSGFQIGQVRVTSKSDQAHWFHLEVLSLKSCESFEHFFIFHQTLGISPKDLQGLTALACPLAILPQILTFVTRKFIGSCVIRCAFWLVSRKDDCLEHLFWKTWPT